MEKLGSGLKKVLLAGIGAVAVTGEKSKELLDEILDKMTPEQMALLKQRIDEMEKKQKEFEAAETVEDAEEESACEEEAADAAEEDGAAENKEV